MFAPPPRPDFSAPAISLFLDGPQASLERPAAPSPTPETTPVAAVPGQRAQVSEPIGLVLRAGPDRETAAIGGVAFEEFIVILEREGEWERIRRELNNQEGWVRAGNTRVADPGAVDPQAVDLQTVDPSEAQTVSPETPLTERALSPELN